MAMRFGVGLGAMALVLGVATSAQADEAAAAAKAKGAEAAPLKAKAEKESELDELEVGTEDLKAKKEKQVAQAAPGQRVGNTTRQQRKIEEEDQPEAKPRPRGLPARVPWRGTAISWGNNATASALGIGDDFQSTAFQNYTQTFGASLNYFVIDQRRWSLAVQASPSFNVEITDSQSTTRRGEPWFNDLPLNVVYRRTLHVDPAGGAWATGLVLRARAFLPTSPASYNGGTYLRTQPAVIMWQSFPGIPKDVAPVLNSWVIGAVANWTHRFGDSTTDVNFGLPDIIERQGNVNGSTGLGDGALDQNIQLSGARLTQNTLGQAVFLFLSQPIGPTLFQLSTGFTFSQQFQPPFSSTVQCPENVDTGCGENGEGEIDPTNTNIDPVDTQFAYGFFLSANYFPVPEAGLSFGYSNVDNQLGFDGQRQNVFYNPRAATFSLGLALSIDAIYEVATGPRRRSPFILVAQEKKNDKKRTQPKKGIRNPTGL